MKLTTEALIEKRKQDLIVKYTLSKEAEVLMLYNNMDLNIREAFLDCVHVMACKESKKHS
jgi:tRNA(His) 5'-end guanylyltransferase|tara:strand:- start:755 stop:934 length:180 start_codon:yes stop_codon:yes gene_type:complete